jgi:SAM-dependent methyltransferase
MNLWKKKDPLDNDPSHKLIKRFFHEELKTLRQGHIIEIGSRTRSDISRKSLVPKTLKYTGFDIIEGNNVDVVGDAHHLSNFFENGSVDAIYSLSVFEHLAMPWKAVIEMNKVLKVGGFMLHTTHQTWPMHEMPWDYWRFSKYTWNALLNRKSGFEILDAQMGEIASTTPAYIHKGVEGLDQFPCYLNSVVLCRKTSETTLSWDMEISDIESQPYPY